MAGLGGPEPLLLLRGDAFYLGDPVPTAACTRAAGTGKRGHGAPGQFREGPKLPPSFKCASNCLGAFWRPPPHSRNTGLSLSWQGAAGDGAGAGTQSLCRPGAAPLQPPESGRNSSPCHHQGAPGRGSLAYGVSSFSVTSGVLAQSPGGAERAGS